MKKHNAVAVLSLALVPLAASAIEFTPENTEVVVAPGAWRNQQVAWFAAQEMTNFLSRAFGAKVPVKTDFNPKKCSIVLGSNTWSVAAGIDTAKLPQDGFATRTKGNAVFIAGLDANQRPWYNHGCFARATLFGAYEFLEKFVGCRFYFPGELGEIVPRVKSFVVPETDAVSAPKLTERHFTPNVGEWYEPNFKEKRYMPLSNLRLRMQTRPLHCCHGLRFFRYVRRFGETHPEYFLMKKDGTRDIMDTGREPYHKNNKFCYSSAGFKEEIYQDVKAYLTGQPPESRGLKKWGNNCHYGEYVDIMPEDGTIHCFCPACTAAYAAAKDPKCESNEIIWNYTIDIAERLKREGVKGSVMQMAYGAYKNVPDRAMPDNVHVTVCNNGGWVKPDRADRDFAQVKAWYEKAGKVKLYSNCGKFGCYNMDIDDVPTQTPRAMAKFYNRMLPMVRGAYMSNRAERAIYCVLNWYVFSRIAWYGHVDIDALLDEYYRLMFGAAAKPMQEFFEEVERRWMDGVLGASFETDIGTSNFVATEFRVWTEIYSEKALKPLVALFEKAEASVSPDSMEAKRIALMRREFLDRMVKRSRDYNENLSVEREKARRAANPPKSVIVGEVRPVTIKVDQSMTEKPFYAVKFPADLKQGKKYRISYFLKGENLKPYQRRGGAQAVVWFNEAEDRAKVVPNAGLEGTFDWVHQSAEVYVPKKLPCDFKPEVDLRILYATGTAHFDGIIVEEVGK